MDKRRHQYSVMNREQLAAVFRERIYGSITILAVNIGLLLKTDLTVEHAFIAIISTVIGLWLAGLFSSILSYRIVHEKNMPRREFAHEIIVHRGLLMAGSSSVIMLTVAAIGIISVNTAIITDIILAITALTVTILRGTRVGSNTVITALISIGLQVAIAGLIVLLKLGAK